MLWWTLLEQEAGLDVLWRSLPTQFFILQSYDPLLDLNLHQETQEHQHPILKWEILAWTPQQEYVQKSIGQQLGQLGARN